MKCWFLDRTGTRIHELNRSCGCLYTMNFSKDEEGLEKPYHLAEELLAVGGCRGRVCQFSLGVWLLAGCHGSVNGLTLMHIEAALV